ncbi:MAG: hypothetical protein HY360_05305 [Verrucomicrobia bacterium]|nr:hypothetical protein [Verrucomicrobiota bacterium]
MTSKERTLAAIRFDRPDKIPIWQPYFDPGFVRQWQRFKGVGEEMHPLGHYRHDVGILMGDERFFPSQAGFLRQEGEHEISNNGWGCVVRSRPGTYFSEEIDRALKTPNDLERLAFEPASLPSRYNGLEERAREARETGLCAFTKLGGLYIRTHFMRGEDKLLVDMADPASAGFCNALFDRVTEHFTQMALETLKRTQTYDTGLFVYDDMAGVNSPMFSPRMFARYFLPRYQRIIASCRKAGCQHFFIHSDGNVSPLLDLFIAAGFEGVNPLEPRCNPGLAELRAKYGKKLVLTGGICNTEILPRNNRKEIESHLRPLIKLAQDGGVILGMHSAFKELPPEAYDFAMRLIEDGNRA